MNQIIFKAKVGSHAYGTNVEGSDEDFKGVYIQSPEDVLDNGYREQYSVNKDETYYELRRFIELCCTGNPTMLELLYSPDDCVIEKHPVFDELVKFRDRFLSKSCKYSFGGYAYAQIDKARGLEKKMNWEKERTERKTPLDFCYVITPLGSRPLREWLHYQKNEGTKQENYGVSVINNCRDLYFIYPSDGTLGYHGIINKDETSNDLCLSSIPKEEMLKATVMSYNKDGYIKHCKDYKEYTTWLNERNTQRYVDIENHQQKIDGKNLLHCYRLIETGIEIAKHKTINVRRPNAEFLIGIRKGKHNLDDLLKGANAKLLELDKAFEESDLPDKVDRGFFLSLMVKLRKQFYGR
jgi:uncharacterized protein